MAEARVGSVVIDRVGEPLPIAVTGGPGDLSIESQREIRGLMRKEPVRFLIQLGWNWLLMLSAIAGAIYLENVVVAAIVVLFVGTRQNVLAVLMHEQVHRSAFQSRFGELITNLFCAYPLGVTLEHYRRVHLAHHQGFFTERDPDFARKQGEDWTFPQLAWHLLKNFIRDLLALNLWRTIRSKRMETPSKGTQQVGTTAWVQPAYYLVVGACVSATVGWQPIVVFWILPWATVLQAIVRWAAICEHKYNLMHPTVAEATPLILLSWWERILLPNLNFTTFHVYHHFYPKVPWSNLRAVHEIYRREGFVNEAHIFRGYMAYLTFLLQATTNDKAEQHSHAAPLVQLPPEKELVTT